MDGYEGVKSILYNMLMSTKKSTTKEALKHQIE